MASLTGMLAANYARTLNNWDSAGGFFSKATPAKMILGMSKWGIMRGPGAATATLAGGIYGGYSGYRREGTIWGGAKGAMFGSVYGRAGVGAFRYGRGLYSKFPEAHKFVAKSGVDALKRSMSPLKKSGDVPPSTHWYMYPGWGT